MTTILEEAISSLLNAENLENDYILWENVCNDSMLKMTDILLCGYLQKWKWLTKYAMCNTMQ